MSFPPPGPPAYPGQPGYPAHGQPGGFPPTDGTFADVAMEPAAALALAELVVMEPKPDPRPLRISLGAEILGRHANGFSYRAIPGAGTMTFAGNPGRVTVSPIAPGITRVSFQEGQRFQLIAVCILLVCIVGVAIMAMTAHETGYGRSIRRANFIRDYWYLFEIPLVIALGFFLPSMPSRSGAHARLFRQWAAGGAPHAQPGLGGPHHFGFAHLAQGFPPPSFPPQPQPGFAPPPTDPAAMLHDLHRRFQAGLISPADYEQAKAAALARMV